MYKKLCVGVLVLLMVAALAVAGLSCAEDDVAVDNDNDRNDIADEDIETITWRYQSMWVPSITLWRGDKYFADLMNILAYPHLEIDYYEGGSLVTTSDELFDGVAAGTLEMGSDWPSYWEGKNTAFGLITSTPCVLTPGDYMQWFWQAGGLELSQDLYEQYNIVWFPHSVTGPESGQRSNVPIYTVDDYADVKMRQCGRGQAMILEDLGGAAIFMPGAEIYLALELGTIDAAEFSVPECDWHMGFQEVTEYWVVPGWHQPGPVSGLMVNKDAYDALPDRVKFMFKEASMATMMWAWTYFEYSSIKYTQLFLDEGITITRIEDDELDQIQRIAWDYLIADAKENPDHAKIAFSQVKYLHEFDSWRSAQDPFMFGRTPQWTEEVYEELMAIAQDHGVYEDVIALEARVRDRMEAQKFWEMGTPYVENPVAP